MTNEKKRRAGKPSPQAPVRRAKLQRIPMEELEGAIEGSITALDEIVMLPLRTALHGIGDHPLSALLQRKLLPHKIGNALEIAEMLSQWLVFARAAGEITGAPASILLAEIRCGSQWISGVRVQAYDWFETGKAFTSSGAALLDHASYLVNAPKFQPVMCAKDDPAKYVAAIGACELWDDLGRKDRLDIIIRNNLQECDVPPNPLCGLTEF
jgi:hypothetical protein